MNPRFIVLAAAFAAAGFLYGGLHWALIAFIAAALIGLIS